MNILLINTGCYSRDSVAGGDRQIIRLAKALKFHNLTLLGSPAFIEEAIACGCDGRMVTAYGNDKAPTSALGKLWWNIMAGGRGIDCAKRIPAFDLAHAASDGWHDLVTLDAASAKRKSFTVHMEIRLQKLSDLYLWFSQKIGRQMSKKFGYLRFFTSCKLAGLNWGQNAGYLGTALGDVPCKSKVADYDAIYVGRDHPQKNMALVHATAQAIATQGGHVAVVGIEKGLFGESRRIAYFPRASEAHTLDLISRSGFLFLPSVHEGVPTVMAEALAIGTPVLTWNVDWAYEAIGGSPVTVKYMDSKAFIDKAVMMSLGCGNHPGELVRRNHGPMAVAKRFLEQ